MLLSEPSVIIRMASDFCAQRTRADDNSGKFRSMIFIPEVTTALQDMLRDDNGDSREVACHLLSDMLDSGWSCYLLRHCSYTHCVPDFPRETVFTPATITALGSILHSPPGDHRCQLALNLIRKLWFIGEIARFLTVSVPMSSRGSP
jgi:hypothetical protein